MKFVFLGLPRRDNATQVPLLTRESDDLEYISKSREFEPQFVVHGDLSGNGNEEIAMVSEDGGMHVIVNAGHDNMQFKRVMPRAASEPSRFYCSVDICPIPGRPAAIFMLTSDGSLDVLACVALVPPEAEDHTTGGAAQLGIGIGTHATAPFAEEAGTGSGKGAGADAKSVSLAGVSGTLTGTSSDGGVDGILASASEIREMAPLIVTNAIANVGPSSDVEGIGTQAFRGIGEEPGAVPASPVPSFVPRVMRVDSTAADKSVVRDGLVSSSAPSAVVTGAAATTGLAVGASFAATSAGSDQTGFVPGITIDTEAEVEAAVAEASKAISNMEMTGSQAAAATAVLIPPPATAATIVVPATLTEAPLPIAAAALGKTASEAAVVIPLPPPAAGAAAGAAAAATVTLTAIGLEASDAARPGQGALRSADAAATAAIESEKNMSYIDGASKSLAVPAAASISIATAEMDISVGTGGPSKAAATASEQGAASAEGETRTYSDTGASNVSEPKTKTNTQASEHYAGEAKTNFIFRTACAWYFGVHSQPPPSLQGKTLAAARMSYIPNAGVKPKRVPLPVNCTTIRAFNLVPEIDSSSCAKLMTRSLVALGGRGCVYVYSYGMPLPGLESEGEKDARLQLLFNLPVGDPHAHAPVNSMDFCYAGCKYLEYAETAELVANPHSEEEGTGATLVRATVLTSAYLVVGLASGAVVVYRIDNTQSFTESRFPPADGSYSRDAAAAAAVARVSVKDEGIAIYPINIWDFGHPPYPVSGYVGPAYIRAVPRECQRKVPCVPPAKASTGGGLDGDSNEDPSRISHGGEVVGQFLVAWLDGRLAHCHIGPATHFTEHLRQTRENQSHAKAQAPDSTSTSTSAVSQTGDCLWGVMRCLHTPDTLFRLEYFSESLKPPEGYPGVAKREESLKGERGEGDGEEGEARDRFLHTDGNRYVSCAVSSWSGHTYIVHVLIHDQDMGAEQAKAGEGGMHASKQPQSGKVAQKVGDDSSSFPAPTAALSSSSSPSSSLRSNKTVHFNRKDEVIYCFDSRLLLAGGSCRTFFCANHRNTPSIIFINVDNGVRAATDLRSQLRKFKEPRIFLEAIPRK